MKLSIIIPAYNVEKYIKQCIDSLLLVALDKEIIIINDGSTDKTFDILSQYQHLSEIKIINQENKGVAYSRNLGINIAKGDYISFIDSDDFIDPTNYTRFATSTIDNQLVIGCCNFTFYYPNGNQKIYYRSEELKHQGLTTGDRHFSVAERTKCYLGSMCIYIFKRDFLLRNSLLCNENVATYENAIFMIKALSYAESVQYFDIPCYFYRQGVNLSRSNSKTYQHIHALFTFIKEMENIAQIYKDNKPEFAISLYHRILHILKRAQDFEKKDYYIRYIFHLPKYILYNFKIKNLLKQI